VVVASEDGTIGICGVAPSGKENLLFGVVHSLANTGVSDTILLGRHMVGALDG
jgi:hypothetical protein